MHDEGNREDKMIQSHGEYFSSVAKKEFCDGVTF